MLKSDLVQTDKHSIKRIKKVPMKNKSNVDNITSWLFVLLFFILGVLNLIFVHPVPGMVYLMFSLIYLPTTNKFIKNKFRFSIPLVVKIILGLVILWATLAVGDLMEMFESWLGV